MLPRAAGGSERGSSVVEAVIILPVAMVVILLAVQAALWAHCATIVQEAAGAGDQVARAYGSSVGSGEAAARSLLDASASGLLSDPQVSEETLPAGMIEVRVSGYAESLLPWLHLRVSAVRIGPEQRFRQSG